MKPVQIYTTESCPFCHRAKDLLKAENVPYQEVDVTGDDAARASLLERSGGQRTVPQIFIGETHVGGYTDLAALKNQGKLAALLAD
jgi:glutaredoxin 3